jgi:pimeloyl-ACP methyl ester carboxylesterase
VKTEVVIHREGARGPVLVFVPGFIQNAYAFSLGERCMPTALARAGFRVWTVDILTRGAPDMADYAALVGDVVREARAASPRVGLLGHSMGGLLSVSLDDGVRELVDAITLVGTPLLPGIRRAALTHRGAAILSRAVARRGRPFRGRLIGKLMRTARPAVDHPVARHPFRIWHQRSTHPEVLRDALDRAFRDDSWAAFADMLELVATGGERMGRVDFGERLRSLAHPLLVLAGDRDGLAPPESTRPLFARAGSHDKRFVLLGRERCGASFGHIDLLVGDRAHDFVLPEVRAFFAARLGAATP